MYPVRTARGPLTPTLSPKGRGSPLPPAVIGSSTLLFSMRRVTSETLDSYPPALAFVGPPTPPRPPSPPTRRIEILESGEVERGEIPVVEIPVLVLGVQPQRGMILICTMW
jgi:hypothetical protein